MGNPFNVVTLKTNITMAPIPTAFSEPAASDAGKAVDVDEEYSLVLDTEL